MTPKDFIQKVLIEEVGEIHLSHPYISFLTMAVGIEFLGKSLNEYEDWNEPHRSRKDFELAINTLTSFDKYKPLLASHDFWTSFRNGFAHSFVPKGTISLSSKNEAPHFTDTSLPKVNLRCEDFYIDFKNACEEVIKMTSFQSNKMNRPLLSVPDTNISFSGTTQN